MAANKELFWLGVGVICIDGKDYGAGTPLPVSKIDKGNLKKMIGDGRIGGMIEKIEVGCKDCAGHLETIQAKNSLIEEMKLAAKDGIERISFLEGEANSAADLKAAHAKEHKDNPVVPDAELTKELADVKLDNEEKAALIKDQKAEIKASKKELKDEVARLTSELDEATKPTADTGDETGS